MKGCGYLLIIFGWVTAIGAFGVVILVGAMIDSGPLPAVQYAEGLLMSLVFAGFAFVGHFLVGRAKSKEAEMASLAAVQTGDNGSNYPRLVPFAESKPKPDNRIYVGWFFSTCGWIGIVGVWFSGMFAHGPHPVTGKIVAAISQPGYSTNFSIPALLILVGFALTQIGRRSDRLARAKDRSEEPTNRTTT